MKSFKIILLLFIVVFIVLFNLTVEVNGDLKICSTGCEPENAGNFQLINDDGNDRVKRDTAPSPTGNASEAIIPTSPDYNGPQLKKLALPIGIVSGLLIGFAILYLVWKGCFKPPVDVEKI